MARVSLAAKQRLLLQHGSYGAGRGMAWACPAYLRVQRSGEVMLVQSQPVLCSPGGAGRALAVQEGQRVGLAEPHLRCESLQHSLLH